MSISRKNFLRLSGLGAATWGALEGKDPENSKPSILIKPKRLYKGCTLGLVAPGSPIYNDSEFDEMIDSLNYLGYILTLGKHVRNKNGYLAGTDKDRAADLMEAFLNSETDAILCIRGGWGCNRILPLLDFERIRSSPKPLIGFSDITSLHMAIFKRTGLITFHGPVGKSDWNAFTVEAWNRVLLNGELPVFEIPKDETGAFTIQQGIAKGTLLGGNLTVLTSLMGSEYLPDFENTILFLEDIGEDVYRIDRMLTQLKLNGILDKLSGFVFGKCTDCKANSNSLTLEQVFEDHIKPLQIPAFYGAMISHEDRNITLPVGIQAEIDSGKQTITLLESGVI